MRIKSLSVGVKILIRSATIASVAFGISLGKSPIEWSSHDTTKTQEYQNAKDTVFVQQQNKTPSTAEQGKDVNGQKEKEYWPKWLMTFVRWIWDGKNANPIIALTTILLALWGIIQIWISIRSGRHQLRAYVAVDKEKRKNLIEDISVNGDSVHGSVFFRNYGQTPAHNSRLNLFVFSGPVKNPNIPAMHRLLSIKNEHGGYEIIPPGGYGKADCNTRIPPETKAVFWKEWLDKDIAIYAVGAVIYRDCFNRCWRNEFRVKYLKTSESSFDEYVGESGNYEKRHYWWDDLFVWFFKTFYPMKP